MASSWWKKINCREGFVTASPLHRLTAALLSAAILSAAWTAVRAEDSHIGCNEDAMLVFDASGSMAEMGYNGLAVPRIFEARDALRAALPQVAPFRRLGLVTYGPGPNDACSNVDLRFEPIPDAAAPILAEVDRIQPEGDTPLTMAVGKAAEVFLQQERPGVVVLVTDGRDTCGGTPCALAEELIDAGADLTVHVIGFKIRGNTFDPKHFGTGGFEVGGEVKARCLADVTGGVYVSAENTDELTDALQQTLGCALLSEGGFGFVPS